MDKTATNVSGETLSNRNPRFELKPGQSIVLNMETISHAVRNWIRSGALKLGDKEDPAEAVAKAPAKAKAVPKKASPKAATASKK